jgi:hypothetical protein
MGKTKKKVILDNNILTESQKTELKCVIDQLVEERTQEIIKEFVKKYTGFIVESATKKILTKAKSGVVKHINEEIDKIKNTTEKVVRSVVLESSNKVAESKKATEHMVEEFKKTAPKLIDKLSEEKAQKIAEESLRVKKQSEKSIQIVEGVLKGLEGIGYVINEDVDQIGKKSKNEIMSLKTELTKIKRDLRIAELTEGMLPDQKDRVIELLEEYTTANKVEQVFGKIRDKVIEENTFVKTEKKAEPKPKVISEEDNLDSLLGLSKTFLTQRL